MPKEVKQIIDDYTQFYQMETTYVPNLVKTIYKEQQGENKCTTIVKSTTTS